MNPQKIIYFLLGLAIVGLPLFLNIYSDDEFTFNKTSFFRLSILVILAILFSFSVYCLAKRGKRKSRAFTFPSERRQKNTPLACYGGENSLQYEFRACSGVNTFYFFSNIKSYWNNFKPYFIVLGLYLLVCLLSTIFSYSPFLSFFGSGRQQGLLQYFFYLLFFLIILLVVKSKKIIYFLYLMVGASFLVSILGILEYFNIRPFEFPVYDWGVASTLGHPSFLGAYLVMIIPITIGLIFIVSSRFSKTILVLTVILQMVTLFLTRTRAAWIAFILSFFVAFVLFLIRNKRQTLLSLLFVLFLGLSIFLISTNASNQIFDYKEGSGALRIIWWGQALEAIQKRPILGYGLETQEDVLMSYYHPLQGVYSFYNLRVDRPHNEVLDQLLTTGILGTILFFGFIILLFKEGIRYFLKAQDKKQQIILLALLTGIMAYFLQGMFSFSVTVLYVYFWLFSALVIILVRGREEKDSRKKEN